MEAPEEKRFFKDKLAADVAAPRSKGNRARGPNPKFATSFPGAIFPLFTVPSTIETIETFF